MIEEDQDRHVPSSWQYRDVDVDIDDPDIRRLIDEYRKPKTKQDRIKTVRAKRKRERHEVQQMDLQVLQHLKRTTDYLEPDVRLPRPDACLLCKESFEDVSYHAKGLCETCYWKYKKLCKLDPDLAMQKSTAN